VQNASAATVNVAAPAALRAGTGALTLRWYVLIVMCLIYAINIADRYVVSTVLEPIRLDLGLGDAGVAFLTGVPLGLFYVSFGIPIAWLADRTNRRNILAASLLVWSGFTAWCGLARAYWPFLFGRIGVGVGEAGGTPACNAIISDYFVPARRPMALAVYSLGAPLGAWLGADLAGAVAQAFGWRAALLALGVPGIALAAIVYLTVREPPRGSLDGADGGRVRASGGLERGNPANATSNATSNAASIVASIAASLRAVWRQRAAFHVIMAAGVCSLWGWGLIWWTPTFLMRAYHLNVGEAGAVTGHVHLVGGVVATAGTAWWLSRPAMVDPRRVVWMLAIGIGLATIPSILAYSTHSLATAKLMFWLFIPAIYFYIGPCMGLVLNLAPVGMRAIFTAWSVLAGNLFNLIVAPQAVGFLSDWYGGAAGTDDESLRMALLWLAPTGWWAVAHFLLAARTIVADQRRATGGSAP
jgi:MFS family permease